MKGYWKTVLTVITVALLSALLSCNTIRGIGRDIERGGEEIQDATRPQAWFRASAKRREGNTPSVTSVEAGMRRRQHFSTRVPRVPRRNLPRIGGRQREHPKVPAGREFQCLLPGRQRPSTDESGAEQIARTKCCRRTDHPCTLPGVIREKRRRIQSPAAAIGTRRFHK